MVSSCTAPSRRSMAATPPLVTRAPRRPWALSATRRASSRLSVSVAMRTQQAGHDIDHQGHDHRPEEVRHQGVPQRYATNGLRREVRVGYLEGHADGEGEIGEVEVGRWVLLVEVDGATGRLVVRSCVAQHEDGVDGRPGEADADDADGDEVGLRPAVRLARQQQHQPHGGEQRHAGGEHDRLGNGPAAVLNVRVALGFRGVQPADLEPGPHRESTTAAASHPTRMAACQLDPHGGDDAGDDAQDRRRRRTVRPTVSSLHGPLAPSWTHLGSA